MGCRQRRRITRSQAAYGRPASDPAPDRRAGGGAPHPHADTETILSAVRSGLPDVSRQAVYDVLNALTSVGLIRRIQPLGIGCPL